MFEKNTALSRNALKYIAIVFMIIDHLAYSSLLPLGHYSLIIVRMFTRITCPIMCYFIAEGYTHTKNVKKYALRLFVFSVISAFPFSHFATGSLFPVRILNGNIDIPYHRFYIPFFDITVAVFEFSVISTLFLSLVAIIIWDKGKMHPAVKVFLTAVILLLSTFCDWGMYGVLFCLIFWYFKDKPVYKWSSYVFVCILYLFNALSFSNTFYLKTKPIGISIMKIGTLFAIPVLEYLYNGTQGRKTKFDKWFFYILYPAHILVIDIIYTLSAS